MRSSQLLLKTKVGAVYQHRVLSFVNGMLVPMPINIDTVNMLYGFTHNADTIQSFYNSRAELIETPSNLKEAVIARVGSDLYELMFQNYTAKQWGMDAEKLPAAIAGRVLTRNNRDNRYFTDRYQGMPRSGYTALFFKMLQHQNIEVRLKCSYSDLPQSELGLRTLYTGSIDEYLNYSFGKLPYRSLVFDFKTFEYEKHQPVAVVNYPNDYDFTRITEFKHWTGEKSLYTTVVYEYPCATGEPYYPMPTAEAQALYERYRNEVRTMVNIQFMGRLGSYRYMNIDQVVLEAMEITEAK